MKKITILIIAFSTLTFSASWISYDFKYEMEDDYGTSLKADSGPITLGFETPLSEDTAMGISYDIVGAEYNGVSGEAQMCNIYSKYSMPLDNQLSLWRSLGYNIPTGDTDYLEGGVSYGFGMLHSSGVGFHYMIHNFAYPEDDYYYEFDITITRMGLSYSF